MLSPKRFKTFTNSPVKHVYKKHPALLHIVFHTFYGISSRFFPEYNTKNPGLASQPGFSA